MWSPAQRLVLLATLLLAVCARTFASTAAPEPPPGIRQHYQVVSSDGAVLYDVTEIHRASEERSEDYVLVRDADHGEYVVRHVWSYKDQTVVLRLSDVRDTIFVQAVTKSPFTAKTRTATLKEARLNPEISMVPATLKIETNGSRWDGVATEWEDMRAKRTFRYSLRQSLDRFLLETIERMRGTPFHDGTMDLFHASIGQLVLYIEKPDHVRGTEMRQREAAADCDFDARFGFPCSTRQLARVKKAVADGKPLTQY